MRNKQISTTYKFCYIPRKNTALRKRKLQNS